MNRRAAFAVGLAVMTAAVGPLPTAVALPARPAVAAVTTATPVPTPTRHATAKPKPKPRAKTRAKAKRRVTRKPSVKASPRGMATAQPMVGEFTVVAMAKRVPLPTWSGPELLTGNNWSTTTLAGAVTVVNFWASWCPSCKEEWQALQNAAAARPKVRFYAVDTMDRRGDAEAFVQGHPSSFPVIFDARSVLQSSFTTVPTHALPFTLVLDGRGRIAAWKSGPTSAAMLEQVLDSNAI